MAFERDISIDPDGLDVEWLQQSNLTFKYSKELAEISKKVDKLKLTLDVVAAELDEKIRTVPENYGIDKITEAAVKSAITKDKAYQEAQHEYIEMIGEQKLLMAAVKAIDTKKSALENLVRLAQMNYFSTPTEARNLTQEAVKAKAANDKIKVAMEENAEVLRRKRK